jgi:hypothetical protein
MRRTISTKLTAVLTGVFLFSFGLAALSSAANAHTIGAFAGNPLDGVPWSCYSENAGAVVGPPIGMSCAGTDGFGPRWEVNLPIETSGSYTVSFTAHSNSSFPINVGCEAVAVNDTAGTIAFSNHLSTASATYVSLTLNPLTVPAGGKLFVACDGLINGTVGTITW